MLFRSRVRKRREYHPEPACDTFPHILLLRSDWNDFGYYTSFDIHYFKDATTVQSCPYDFRIVHREEGTTTLPESFSELGEAYYALGSSTEFYEWMISTFEVDGALDVLRALRDVIVLPAIREEARTIKGFVTSALRMSESEKALNEAGQLFGIDRPSSEPFKFTFTCLLEGFGGHRHVVPVDFSSTPGDKNGAIPHRMICFVGKNGTGKSGVLSKLALTLSGLKPEDGEFSPARPLLRRTVCISYSPFQAFEVPRLQTSSYRYCGLQDGEGVVRPNAISVRTKIALNEILERGRLEQWRRLVMLEDVTGHIENKEDLTTPDKIEGALSTLSTGQRMLVSIASDLVANLDSDSLVLMDEPESYLHPTLLSTLLRVVDTILKEHQSFAIVATHSPIVVQEVPARMVRIFDRAADQPRLRQLRVESFGANLTDLVDQVFTMSPDDKNYQARLRAAVGELGSVEAVKSVLASPPLTLNAALFLDSLDNGE